MEKVMIKRITIEIYKENLQRICSLKVKVFDFDKARQAAKRRYNEIEDYYSGRLPHNIKMENEDEKENE